MVAHLRDTKREKMSRWRHLKKLIDDMEVVPDEAEDNDYSDECDDAVSTSATPENQKRKHTKEDNEGCKMIEKDCSTSVQGGSSDNVIVLSDGDESSSEWSFDVLSPAPHATMLVPAASNNEMSKTRLPNVSVDNISTLLSTAETIAPIDSRTGDTSFNKSKEETVVAKNKNTS